LQTLIEGENMRQILRSRPCTWKGIVAGVAGGLAGTIAMTQFQNAWTQAAKALQTKKESDNGPEKEQGEDATMKAAGKLASIAGHPLSHEEKKKVSPVVHCGFGTAIGAVYGLAHEFAPRPAKRLNPLLSGTGYGSLVFLSADEIAVPALGLSQSPDKTPLSSHLYAWVSHLVYGMTLEMVRKSVRERL
jgi:putative membrane protein